MLESPEFEAVWQCIKRWDISRGRPEHLYTGATGNHVREILDALAPVLAQVRAEGEKADPWGPVRQLVGCMAAYDQAVETIRGLQARISTFEESSAADTRCINAWAERHAALSSECEALKAEIERLREHQDRLNRSANDDHARISAERDFQIQRAEAAERDLREMREALREAIGTHGEPCPDMRVGVACSFIERARALLARSETKG